MLLLAIVIISHCYYHHYYYSSWVFIKGGCSRRGVQWMGVVLYLKEKQPII